MEREEFCQNLGFDVSRETFTKLVLYVEILKKWQKKLNLISPNTINSIWQRHILDSAQLLPYMYEDKKIIDLGSGAGFPALVLSILGVENISLIEADRKKCSFLKEVIRQCELKAEVFNNRIEDIKDLKADIITARALTSLDNLLFYSKPMLLNSGYCLFLKGKNYKEEIKQAKNNWDFSVEILPSITSSEAKILKMFHVEQK